MTVFNFIIFIIGIFGIVCLVSLADESITVKMKRKLATIALLSFVVLQLYLIGWSKYDRRDLHDSLRANEYGANTISQFY